MVRAQVNDETHKQQLPWGHTNLIGSVYLNPSASSETTAQKLDTAPASTASINSDIEVEFWRSIKDSNKLEEYNAYVLKYPNGQFTPIARSRIAALQSQQTSTTTRSTPVTAAVGGEADIFTAEASLATENALGLDPEARRDLQNRLTLIGFQTPINGQFTDTSRRAITRWQTARGYPKTGYLNKLQHQALLKESASASTDARSAEQETPSQPRQSERPSGGGVKNPVAGAGEFIGGVLGGALHGIGGALGKK